MLHKLFLTALLLTLTACGYSLRGTDAITARFSNLQLALAQPNSEFSQLLLHNLEIASVATSLEPGNDTEDATPVLHVAAEQLVSRPVSVNPRARAAQYELRLSVEASMTRGTEFLMEPEILLVERSYFEDIENIAGNQEEMALIASEMRRELASQLMRRLEAVPL